MQRAREKVRTLPLVAIMVVLRAAAGFCRRHSMRRVKRLQTPAGADVAIVEFALLLPLLVFVFLGVEETGRLAYHRIVTANAAPVSGTPYVSTFSGTAMIRVQGDAR